MKTETTLSKHDQDVIERIKMLKKTEGYISWSKMLSLADTIENEAQRKYWTSFAHSNYHLEEAACGCL